MEAKGDVKDAQDHLSPLKRPPSVRSSSPPWLQLTNQAPNLYPVAEVSTPQLGNPNLISPSSYKPRLVENSDSEQERRPN